MNRRVVVSFAGVTMLASLMACSGPGDDAVASDEEPAVSPVARRLIGIAQTGPREDAVEELGRKLPVARAALAELPADQHYTLAAGVLPALMRLDEEES